MLYMYIQLQVTLPKSKAYTYVSPTFIFILTVPSQIGPAWLKTYMKEITNWSSSYWQWQNSQKPLRCGLSSPIVAPLYKCGLSFIAPSKGSEEASGRVGGNVSRIKTTWCGSILSHISFLTISICAPCIGIITPTTDILLCYFSS